MPLLLIEAISLFVQYGSVIYKMVNEKLSIDHFSLLIGSITNYATALNAFIERWAEFQVVLGAVASYQIYTEEIQDNQAVDYLSIPYDSNGNVITFENVSFRYPNAEDFSIKDLTMTISAHEQLAIVGGNGAGKTTLIKLLCRLYEPTQGKITFNGVAITSFTQEEWLKQLGTVLQDFQIFAIPLWQNICLNEKLNIKKLQRILEESDIENRISELKNGVNQEMTKSVTDDGAEFSGGENQKLASARALYQNAEIMLLDEPTSALDPIAESKLFRNFQRLTEDKTSIYITHRLAAVRFCDKIAVLDQGRLVEYGNHYELMNGQGIYFDMFSKQAKYYVDEVMV